MKKLFILSVLAVAFLSSNALAQRGEFTDSEIYTMELARCDNMYVEQMEAAVNDKERVQANYNAVKCYGDLGNKVIDKYYSKSAFDKKANLKNYIDNSYIVTRDIYEQQDFCTPRCGSLSEVTAKATASDMVRFVVEQYIVAASRNGD